MDFSEQLKKCKKVIADASVKNEKCVKCGKEVVAKSFCLLPGKHTSEGYVCAECAEKEKEEKAKAAAAAK